MEPVDTQQSLSEEVKFVVNDIVVMADHFEPDPEISEEV